MSFNFGLTYIMKYWDFNIYRFYFLATEIVFQIYCLLITFFYDVITDVVFIIWITLMFQFSIIWVLLYKRNNEFHSQSMQTLRITCSIIEWPININEWWYFYFVLPFTIRLIDDYIFIKSFICWNWNIQTIVHVLELNPFGIKWHIRDGLNIILLMYL